MRIVPIERDTPICMRISSHEYVVTIFGEREYENADKLRELERAGLLVVAHHVGPPYCFLYYLTHVKDEAADKLEEAGFFVFDDVTQSHCLFSDDGWRCFEEAHRTTEKAALEVSTGKL